MLPQWDFYQSDTVFQFAPQKPEGACIQPTSNQSSQQYAKAQPKLSLDFSSKAADMCVCGTHNGTEYVEHVT